MNCIYILSHNRPDNIPTVEALKKSNNTLPIFLVVGDDDPQLEKYKKIHDNLIIFNKTSIDIDSMSNFNEMGAPLFARKYIEDHAKQNNIENYVMLDDDYNIFGLRYTTGDKTLHQKRIQNITEVFNFFFQIQNSMKKNIQLSFGQNGDYIGGADSRLYKKGVLYKCMNVFICHKDYPIPFQGIFNDDLNGGLNLVKKGIIPITIKGFTINQEQTQLFEGGLTHAYRKYGTYVKSFYSIMLCPTAVKIQVMGSVNYRLHHQVQTEHAIPKIIQEKYKKK